MSLRRWRIALAIAAAAGGAATAIGASLDLDQFFRSYFVSFIFWFEVTMGALLLALIHPLVGGAWGEVLRKALRGCVRTLPVVAVLFVPLAFGLSRLYLWAQPGAAADPKLAHKLVYLNQPFFLARAAVYFAGWSAIGWYLLKWTREQHPRLEALCACGIVVYFLTGTLAAVDWLMSLERDYDSSVFGFAFIAGQCLAALALTLTVTQLIGPPPATALSKAPQKAFRDLGGLLAVTVLVWAYLQFSQYLINWSGDTTREISWYLHRRDGGWRALAWGLVLLHFAVPLFVLLFRGVKDQLRRLAGIGSALLVAHVAEVYWLVVPSYPTTGPSATQWLDLAAFVAIGAVWLGTLSFTIEPRGAPP